MTQPSGRIWFAENPWPGGHALKTMEFWGHLACVHQEDAAPELLLQLNIKSQDFSSETPKAQLDAMYEAEERQSDRGAVITDWRSLSVWNNYHACHINTNEAVVLGTVEKPFSLNDLDGMALRLDTLEDQGETQIDFDGQAFQCYILGHDAVADHDIQIRRSGETANLFDIDWKGRVALAYVGQSDYQYRFRAELRAVPFAGFEARHRQKYDGKEWRNFTRERPVAEREKELRDALARFIKVPQDALSFAADERCDWLKF